MIDPPSQIPRGKARFESQLVELHVNTNMLLKHGEHSFNCALMKIFAVMTL